jgi:hypothetical protein
VTRSRSRLSWSFLSHLRKLEIGARPAEQLATALLELYLGAVASQQLGVGGAAKAARRSARLLVDDACSG